MNSIFLKRFQSLWMRRRRVEIGQAAAWTALAGVLMFCLLAALDYALELRLTTRTVFLFCAAASVLTVGGRSAWRAWRRGSRPTTASELEETFPELGQSVRTTVEFGEKSEEAIRSQGVKGTLVSALAQQTDDRTRPLELDVVVPARRLWAVTAGVALVTAVVATLSSADWQWRTAAGRVLLQNQPYRSLQVEPGSITVDEGSPVEIAVALIGRTDRDVTLLTRSSEEPDAEWTEQSLEPVDSNRSDKNPDAGAPGRTDETTGRPRANYLARFDRMTQPLEYRVVAGDVASDPFRIDIRRPVRIQQISVSLAPPEYTQLPATTVTDGNFSGLDGTLASLQIAFDKPVRSASIVFAAKKSGNSAEPPAEPEKVALTLRPAEGGPPNPSTSLIAATDFPLVEDRNYSVLAEAEDGTRLPENKYRIRVRHDQAPQVSFESPSDGVEVHSLAELPMRVRVNDDYGLTKAGVVFQVNNEQEIPLLAEDFAAVVDAAKEVAETGVLSPKTQSTLERLLPLEHFGLTQKDSVMYFAFAEDNLPGSPQRTETDMRFIDIRPFKRQYQVFDPDPNDGGMNMGGPGLKSLEQLIQMQRFGLNRTLQIEKKAKVGRTPDPTTLDQLMEFETDLASNVRGTAQGLEARGFDDTQLFYQAEAAILQAVDSLSVGKWENATLQMRDALKLLIEQRDRTIESIRKNPDPSRLAQLRAFDRQQAQKLRRPKTDKEEARELIERLEALISQESAVSTSVIETEGATGAESPDPSAEEPVEPPKPQVPAGESPKSSTTAT
jgi:hypothetical protein